MTEIGTFETGDFAGRMLSTFEASATTPMVRSMTVNGRSGHACRSSLKQCARDADKACNRSGRLRDGHAEPPRGLPFIHAFALVNRRGIGGVARFTNKPVTPESMRDFAREQRVRGRLSDASSAGREAGPFRHGFCPLQGERIMSAMRSKTSRTHSRAACAFILLAMHVTASATPLQDIIDQMADNSWARINTNRIEDVWPLPAQTPGSGTPKYVIKSWTGGAWDSNHGYAYVWGGNGAPYSGNEVYRFSTDSMAWERASLPSRSVLQGNTYANGKSLYLTADGPDHSPMSAESYDNVVYLPMVDRLAVMGGSVWPGDGRDYVAADGVTRTGPYFWDPAKADPNKVGGLAGSQVNPQLFPDVLGGEMWENRNSVVEDGVLVGPLRTNYGKTAATVIDGKDVVYMASYSTEGLLFKYTVNSLDAAEDTWEVVGTKQGGAAYFGAGAGALDTNRNAFVQTADNKLIFWDLNNAGPTNPSVRIDPLVLGGDLFSPSKAYGMDFDPILDAFILWKGVADLWLLDPPDVLGSDGWTLRHLTPTGLAPPALSANSAPGIYGKWNYMPGYGTFIGFNDGVSGDVWLYKPLSQVPLPAAVYLFASGLVWVVARRRTQPERRG
ncbi:MAG: hypothetical protein KDK06_22195 [Gammaproteobacteria bacterium]|nr:hypothetical protein [Gammaproteobacteria bacterium]